MSVVFVRYHRMGTSYIKVPFAWPRTRPVTYMVSYRAVMVTRSVSRLLPRPGGNVLAMQELGYIARVLSTGRWIGAAMAVIVASALSPQIVRAQYTESFQTWTASSSGAWETQDLSGAPYNVPANAVVEVAIRNERFNAERWGGVRAVGSSLERRFLLQEDGSGGGVDIVVMHVQADAGSQIQHYADATSDFSFALLGYWTSGTYVEAWDTFTAGADNSWQDLDLCTYGVGPAHAAEIVMTNDHNTGGNHLAGVRTNGSSLDRRIDLQNPESGGVDCGTMFVKADDTAKATVEVNAGDDTYIDFYLVGYWSVPPLAYTELFVDVGSPTADGVWEDLDLSGDGVPADAVAEFALANKFADTPNNIGVRENGSSLARLQNLRDAPNGGWDLGRMHVTADTDSIVDFYHEDVSDAHTFRLVGYWDTCNASISYIITDLGAVTASESSLGFSINATGDVAGYDEDASGDPGAWFSECGSFTSLGTLGGSDAEALGLNDADMVVGWAHDGSGNRKAFTWTSGGGMTDLGTVSGRSDSEAAAVNAGSEVVGTVLDFAVPADRRAAFLYLPAPAYTLGAGMNNLGNLGGVPSVAMDINDSGQVVGGAQNASGDMRPFRWANGTMTDLGTLGGESERITHRANAINSSGDVAGTSYTAGGDAHAFYWDGSMTDLGVLTGGDTSWALGINDTDVVVGTSNVTGGAFHAFVWDSTNGLRDLNDLIDAGANWTLSRAMGINSTGQVTGWGTNPSGDVRAFLLTPSCSAGGGAARDAGPPAGFDVADENGDLETIIGNTLSEPLAEILVVDAEPGEVFEYAVTGFLSTAYTAPGPGGGTWTGFVDGVALPHTLTIHTPESPGDYQVTMSMTYSREELDELGVEPEDLELHVLDTAQAPPPGVWVPAGANIGEESPTGVVGDSGFVVYTDETVDYWAVREAVGVFAVGAGETRPDDNEGSARRSPVTGSAAPCGLGIIQAFMLVVLGLSAIEARRRRC